MCIISAAPLHLVPLHQQIINAGGEGYNTDVRAERVKNSFSTVYYFDTKDGEKALQTRNTYQVVYVNSGENKHYVDYDADKGEYWLATLRNIKKPPYHFLEGVFLGRTAEEAERRLKTIWPERLRWDLTIPDIFIRH